MTLLSKGRKINGNLNIQLSVHHKQRSSFTKQVKQEGILYLSLGFFARGIACGGRANEARVGREERLVVNLNPANLRLIIIVPAFHVHLLKQTLERLHNLTHWRSEFLYRLCSRKKEKIHIYSDLDL